jgi:ArsR family transcriptional regulator, arsenate/arsenite/antimonite-responsive transcriptional repressor
MRTSTDLEATGFDTAAGFAALGDATRLRILGVLAARTHCVCDLRERVDIPANLLSYHLRVLRDAGLVRASRRGRWIDYALDSAALARLRAAIPTGVPDLAGAP